MTGHWFPVNIQINKEEESVKSKKKNPLAGERFPRPGTRQMELFHSKLCVVVVVVFVSNMDTQFLF